MANRIKLIVLGGTLAPYASNNLTPPQFQASGAISEYQSFDVSQLQRNVDCPATITTPYPAALSTISVKYVDRNHFNTNTIYIHHTEDQVNSLANA